MLKVLVGMSSSFFMGLFGVDWQTVDRKVVRAFPAMEFVSTESLLAEAQLNFEPTIIDVRRPDEYDVSHIPKAHNCNRRGHCCCFSRLRRAHCRVLLRGISVSGCGRRAGFSGLYKRQEAWAFDF